MQLEYFGDVNYLAAIVASLAYFAMGFVWYSLLFAKPWQTAMGIEVVEGEQPNPALFGLTLLAYFVSAVVTAVIAFGSATDTAAEGAILGALVGIGYSLTLLGTTVIYDQKPKPLNLWLINGAFNVLALVVVGVIVAAWR